MIGLERRLGLFSTTNLVIANMIGAGIFTTSGLLLAELASPLLRSTADRGRRGSIRRLHLMDPNTRIGGFSCEPLLYFP